MAPKPTCTGPSLVLKVFSVERLQIFDQEWEEIQTFINRFGLKKRGTRKEVNFIDLLREFNRQNIRYLIIGRRAVILYGGPVLTADNDLWITPPIKEKRSPFSWKNLVRTLYPPDTKNLSSQASLE